MTPPAPLKVCVVTAARSEYGLMRWVIQDLADDPGFDLDLVVTGSHLSRRHGHTVDEIRAAGHRISREIPVDLSDDSPARLVAAGADILRGVGTFLAERRPDCVLVLGDRWEIMTVATACVVTGTPLGHFSGGEITEGALDDSVRHALTKLAHLHFVANDTYGARVRQLGEEAWRVSVCGGPGLDNFNRLPRMTRDQLERDLGLDLTRPTALVTLHPPTNSLGTVEDFTDAFLTALDDARRRFNLQYIITGPCADPGADVIETRCRHFAATGAGVYVTSLGQVRYLSLLRLADLMIGNSSSAFHEAPVARLPAVNVGDRQAGRLRSTNIIDVAPTAVSIADGIARALEFDRSQPVHCHYGDGSASARARHFLTDVFATRTRSEILRKRFVDAPVFQA